MGKRPPYCLPEDVLRVYDQQDSIGRYLSGDLDLIRDAIDDASSEFEADTGHAFRLTRVGRSGTVANYEYQDIEGSHRTPPVDVLLNHRYIRPFDSNSDDVLEYRDGRDSWTAITDQAGDEFTLYYDSGKIRVYRWLVSHIYWDARDDRYLRASYRYGAPGGRQDQGGQTTLDGSLDSSATSVSVTDAGLLPQSGTLLIYGDNVEYVDLESVNLSTDTLTVSRGERSMDAASHSDGDTIHYCPEGFRMAIAGVAAAEVQDTESFTDRPGEREGRDASQRIQFLLDRYDKYARKYSGVRKL